MHRAATVARKLHSFFPAGWRAIHVRARRDRNKADSRIQQYLIARLYLFCVNFHFFTPRP